MASTTPNGLPWPELSDPADIEQAVRPLAEALDPFVAPSTGRHAATQPTVRALGTSDGMAAPGPALAAETAARIDGDAQLAATIDAIQARLPARVTALPSSPVDGQEVYYALGRSRLSPPPAADTPALWHLRWHAGAGAWELVGGGWAIAKAPPSSAGHYVQSTSWSRTVDGVTVGVSLPFTGVWEVMWGAARMSTDRSSTGELRAVYLAPTVGTTPVASDALSMFASFGGDGGNIVASPPGGANAHLLTVSGGSLLEVRARVEAAGQMATVDRRWIMVRPRRVW